MVGAQRAVAVDRRGGVGHARDEFVDVLLTPDELAGVRECEARARGREAPVRPARLVGADLQQSPRGVVVEEVEFVGEDRVGDVGIDQRRGPFAIRIVAVADTLLGARAGVATDLDQAVPGVVDRTCTPLLFSCQRGGACSFSVGGVGSREIWRFNC